MIRPTKVNCCRHRHTQRAKDAVRLRPKSARQSVVPSQAWNTRHSRLPVWKAGINSFVSLETNIVNPTFRPAPGQARPQGTLRDGGRGCWKKRSRSVMERTGLQHHSAVQTADFQRVVRDERTRRTSQEKQQMNADKTACASSGKTVTWEQIDWTQLNVGSEDCKRVSSRQLRKTAGQGESLATAADLLVFRQALAVKR